MAGETDRYLSRIAQDRIIPQEEWAERARRVLADAEAYRAMDEAEKGRRMRPTAIYPGGTFNTVPVKPKPNNWLYNTLSDPRINAGLENLVSNASDAIFGMESGNNVVDLGVSNIPVAGPAAILAAGGMPGLVDAVGAGELRNLKRIPQFTYDFVKEFFGDRGLKAVDNALTKYPRAEKVNLNDALHIMKTGIGGDIVPALKPYRSTDVMQDIIDMGALTGTNLTPEGYMKYINDSVNSFKSLANNPDDMSYIEGIRHDIADAIEKNNMPKFWDATAKLQAGRVYMNRHNRSLADLGGVFKYMRSMPDGALAMSQRQIADAEIANKLRRYIQLDAVSPQDWEKIAAEQKYIDENPEILYEQARKAEEAALKAKLSKMSKKERKAFEEKMRKQQAQQKMNAQQEQKNKPAPVVEKEPEKTPEKEINAAEILRGPNRWRENGWDPSIMDNAFYRQFGGNLSPESRRDAFVIDSLANHWAKQIVGSGRKGSLKDAEIYDALSRAEARHDLSSYDNSARGFREDVKKNLQSGNMPGKSVQFGPRFKGNVMVGGDTPTLLLTPKENPRYYDNVRIWADEQEGPDLYELVFRPKADEILNSINPAYWLYRK